LARGPQEKKRGKSKSGNKKHGRSRKKPCHQRYTRELRWITNKRRKVKNHQRRLEKVARKRRERHEVLMNRDRSTEE